MCRAVASGLAVFTFAFKIAHAQTINNRCPLCQKKLMLRLTASNVAALRVPTLSPQHLIFAGPLLKSWLCKVFNTIVNFEAIPSQFKVCIIVPIYKGKGKDPLLSGNYRGIILTSVIAKTFEYLLLDRMLLVLSDNCVPHLNQTAYQRGVSCAYATFSCQETISKFIRDGDSVYSCFYNLASAFDTVEYHVLLSHLKKAGVSRKAWRLIKDWYTNVSSSVTVGRQVSPLFPSVAGLSRLSPFTYTLFAGYGPNSLGFE